MDLERIDKILNSILELERYPIGIKFIFTEEIRCRRKQK